MTREEAIAYGKRVIDLGLNDETQAFCELAIKALEERTEERTETRAYDCISRMTEEEREQTISYLEDMKEEYVEGEGNERYPLPEWYMLDKVIKIISQQPKTGHWVLSGGYWRCSECKEKALLKLDKATGGYREYEPVRSKYCPECGAKMEEKK